jgi:hypothetical protein
MFAEPSAAKLLLKPREAAQRLSISPSLLWRKTASGEIPCVRLSSRLLYDPDALQLYVKSLGAQQYEPRKTLRRQEKTVDIA